MHRMTFFIQMFSKVKKSVVHFRTTRPEASVLTTESLGFSLQHLQIQNRPLKSENAPLMFKKSDHKSHKTHEHIS